MGETFLSSPIADALFPSVQQRVLAVLFREPGRKHSKSEIVDAVGSGTGAVYRVLDRLVDAGLVSVQTAGRRRLYGPNPSAPVFDELSALISKTLGLDATLRKALLAVSDRIAAAFVFGSMADGSSGPESDIDLLVVSDDLAYAELLECLSSAEADLQRAVDLKLVSAAEWSQRADANRPAFLRRVGERPKRMILGTENDLA